MSDFITIPSKVVTCSDGKKDRYVEINTNPAGAPRVRAFIDMFLGSAESASNNCYGLPVNVILTIWGGESLWAADDVHWTNQNWGNLGYNSSNNPVGNIGKGIGGFAKFEGRNKFAKGFAGFLTYGSNYKDLIDYLKQCQQQSKKPIEDRCFYLIAHGGYNGKDPVYIDQWYNGMLGFLVTLEKYIAEFL